MRTPVNRTVLYLVLVTMLAAIAAGVNSVLYANRVGRVAEQHADQDARKLCAIVVTLDNAYRQIPPTTAIGRQLADGMRRLRHDLGCD